MNKDYQFLKETVELAHQAKQNNTGPIGALLVDSSENIVSQSYNNTKILMDPSAHAEMMCLRKAGDKAYYKSSNAQELTLYSSLEPCLGCAFFTIDTTVTRVVWLLSDKDEGMMNYQNIEPIKSWLSKTEVIAEPYADLRDTYKDLLDASI